MFLSLLTLRCMCDLKGQLLTSSDSDFLVLFSLTSTGFVSSQIDQSCLLSFPHLAAL